MIDRLYYFLEFLNVFRVLESVHILQSAHGAGTSRSVWAWEEAHESDRRKECKLRITICPRSIPVLQLYYFAATHCLAATVCLEAVECGAFPLCVCVSVCECVLCDCMQMVICVSSFCVHAKVHALSECVGVFV